MNQEEAAALMRLTSEHVRRAGIGGIVDDIIEDTPEDEPPARQLLRMLDAMDTQMRAKDATTRQRIMGWLTEFVHQPDGRPPEGLWLDLAPAHRDIFQRDRLDMTEGAQLRDVIGELGRLRIELARELDEELGLDA